MDTWQARSLALNTHPWFYSRRGLEFDPTGKVIIDVGAYNQLLGKSYTEIAAESRSMHKSQGFGATGSRGSELEYLQLIKGDSIDAAFFQGSDFTWDRIENGNKVSDLLQQAYEDYHPEAPEQVVPMLMEALA